MVNKKCLVFRQPCLLILHKGQLGLGVGKGFTLNVSGPFGMQGHPLTQPLCGCVTICQLLDLSVSWQPHL